MTRQMDAEREARQARKDNAVLVALEYGLVRDVARTGAVLLGFAVKLGVEDCLMTLKVELAGKKQISFVGAADMPSALLKACKLARQDGLKWRGDKYST